MTLDLYYAPTPNGWKATIMIEELREAGVELPEVRAHHVQLAKGEQFSSEYTAINPNQKIPALVHDGRAIIESGVILQYLAETYPTSLLPVGPERWDALGWVMWQMANLGPVFGNKLSYTRYIDVPAEAKAHPIERFEKEGLRLLAVMDRQLGRHPYLAGESFTIADIAALPWVRAYKWVKIDITTRPRVVEWLERCRARPGVDRGFSYGVPEAEKEKFSKDRREAYKAMGASMAANERLKTDL